MRRPAALTQSRLLFALVALATALLWTARAGPLLRTDQEQARLDTALPLLAEGVRVRQPFIPAHDGLREVEVQVAQYGGPARGHLYLWVEDAAGRPLVEQRFEASALQANQLLTLRLPRQGHSAGQRYAVGARGDGAPTRSLWGYSLPVLEAPLQVEGAPSAAQALRLVTRYELTAPDALARLLLLLRRDLPAVAMALLFLLAPGLLLLTLFPRHALPSDGGSWAALALAAGLALWPLLWHGLTLLGGRWSGPSLWAATLGMAALAAARLWQRLPRRPGAAEALLGATLLGGYALRLLATGDLAFLPWVDSVRHATISAVMATTGTTMRGYAPLLPEVTAFPYHFGFHVLPASLTLMGAPPLAPLLLALQALLNALAALSAYAMVRLMTGRARPALVAAFLISAPFLFLGYYATWGRLTQLTGLLILPPLAGLTWQLLRGPRARRALWPLVALLAAGLFLVHLRVFIFYLPLPLLLVLVGRRRRLGPLLAAALLISALTLPRLVELAAVRRAALGPGEGGSDYFTVIPWRYLLVGWERAWPIAAGGALLVAGAMAWRSRRGRIAAAPPLLVAAWWIALLLGSTLPRVVPALGLINSDSVMIALYLPFATLMGWGAAWLWRAARRWPGARAAGVGLLVALLLAFGVRQQLTILNPQTLLAQPADAAALAWGKANIPRGAVVAINGWSWLNGTWAGSDGGAWLLPLTGLAATTPPADYIYSAPLAARVRAFNEGARRVTDWSSPEAAAWLRAQGVTHLYVGVRGGFLDPAALARNPEIAILYARDGTFWFRVGE